MARRRQWSQAFRLAARDFAHEWRVSLCLVFALAAVLAPLLVLFGLKSGIVTTMTERLKADPRNLEISIRGHHRLDAAWFAAIAARADVGFVVPRTRTLSATVTLEAADGRVLADLDMIPTAAGDPLLSALAPMIPTRASEVLLTATAATKLGIGEGSRMTAVIGRRLGGEAQAARFGLVARGIVPESAFPRDALFAALPLLIASEDYRDGYRVPLLGVGDGNGPAPAERTFAGARLYARDLDAVAPLAAALRAQGLEVLTRADEIASVRAIDRVLSFVFVVLAAIGVGGYLVSLATSLLANVDRKRREIALLRLIGLGTGPVIGFPAVQALLVAAGGLAVSAVLYLLVARAFNAAFAAELARDEFVCRLHPADAALAGLITLAFALFASAIGGHRAAKIDPAESLRQP
jgi:putative ABC transport system permease protein